jgi:glucose/arabinose dehydrogenase
LQRTFIFFISVTIFIAIGAFFQNRSLHAQKEAKPPNEEARGISLTAPTLVRTDFMSELNSPWDMAFTPDGAMLFTEKCRGLSVRRADGSITRLFGTTGAAVMASDLFCEGQSGMHGVAIDPDFGNNRTLYVYMPSNLSTNPPTNRVVRLTVDSSYTAVADRLDIITDIPYKNVGNNWSGAGAHSGGRIRFGPDGFLYVTTGDNHNGFLPQDLTQLGGKVLRVDHDGNAAPGNNTPAGGDPRIFTYGHRNVQGIAFHPTTGQPYIAEHGPGHSDEVTPLVAGGNGGWDPKPEVGVSCADNYCGYISNKPDGTPTPMTDTTKFPNAMQPLLVLNNSQGMGPCTFLTGSQWEGWNGRLVIGIMTTQRLDVLQLDSRGVRVGTTTADLPAERMRSVVQGPDGNLYVATDGGEIWRVTPQ